MKHLLKMSDLSPAELHHILDVAEELKAEQKAGTPPALLKGRSVALMFSKNSTRTLTSERDRKMTIMTTGFIPCGAKMPIIALFAGALFGAVGGLLWDYTAGRTVGMLALELLLLCFALSVLVQVYLQGSTWNFALISTGTALVVLSLDWLFFYYMPGYSWALSRWLTFVLPSAVMTLVPSLVLFSLVRRIYNEFKIDNGVV